jgi:hypothetical protein
MWVNKSTIWVIILMKFLEMGSGSESIVHQSAESQLSSLFYGVNGWQMMTSAVMVICHMPLFSASSSISSLFKVTKQLGELDNVILFSPLSSTSLLKELTSYRQELEAPGFS